MEKSSSAQIRKTLLLSKSSFELTCFPVFLFLFHMTQEVEYFLLRSYHLPHVFSFTITRFLSLSSLQAAGKYRQQGRNYIVEDGDIIFFKFNTPQQPKKK